MRALKYNAAGGCFAELTDDGPIAPIMKFGFEPGCENNFDKKIVLLDEAHTLMKTDDDGRISRLRSLLSSARDTVLAAFTATPIMHGCQGGVNLLDVFGENGSPATLLSMTPAECPFHPATLPTEMSGGCALSSVRAVRELVVRIELKGTALQRYPGGGLFTAFPHININGNHICIIYDYGLACMIARARYIHKPFLKWIASPPPPPHPTRPH